MSEATEKQYLSISLWKGMMPVDFPAEWVDGADLNAMCAYDGREAKIRFRPGLAFALYLECSGRDTFRWARRIGEDEELGTPWGPPCRPFEGLAAAQAFGCSSYHIRLDDPQWFENHRMPL